MKKNWILGFVLVAIIVASAAANAGSVWNQSVNIVTSLNKAYGSVQGARYSSDTTQKLYCVSNSNGSGSCFATNASGLTKSCYTDEPEAVAVIRSMTAYSYVTFSWDDMGKCTYLSVNNGSHYIH